MLITLSKDKILDNHKSVIESFTIKPKDEDVKLLLSCNCVFFSTNKGVT